MIWLSAASPSCEVSSMNAADCLPDRLVGREPERHALRARLAEAIAGRGSLTVLAGESGAGKTSLA
jgi:putative ribosome biogenesis GTPase RsgA